MREMGPAGTPLATPRPFLAHIFLILTVSFCLSAPVLASYVRVGAASDSFLPILSAKPWHIVLAQKVLVE